ncbi:MAG: acyl-CoA dehydrogenase family protein [Alphaproteobacteria bacterium]|nr:acyl-CoA dehydrogenase family protein [Alphaproteobacteria bacterium]MCY4317895.1 acyl-CoA dehydrogenase family protein [Alphaproteobacteria bacterium]
MDLSLTDEQKLIVDQVRRFVREEIVPLEDRLDPDADSLPPEDHERLTGRVAEMGLYGLDIPPEFGGPDVDIVTRTLLAIEMSQHRAGLYAPCYNVFGGAGLAQMFEANEDQKQRFLYPMLKGEKKTFFGLTEPSGGSDPARAIQTRAVRDGDAWVINGTKMFISGADQADFGLVFARTDPGKGRAGVTCFIVETDTPGFHVRRIVHTLRAARYATELQFEDMRVPHANVLGAVNAGFAIANDRVSRQRIPYAATCIGVAVKAQELAIEYARIRETFGDKLAHRQGIQWMVVENEIDIRHAFWTTLAAADKARRGAPFRTDSALAKIVATEASGRVVDRSMQIHGGYGVTKDLPFERWYREMRIRRIGEGPNEVQRHIVARDLFGSALR